MEESTEKEKLEGVPRVSDYINLDKVLVSDKPIMTAKEAIGFVFEKIYGTKEEIAVAIFCDDNLMPLCVATADKKRCRTTGCSLRRRLSRRRSFTTPPT